jgi:hypothetical protein
MWRRVMWIFLGIEALRFASWLLFLLWLTLAYDATTWVGPESNVISGLAALWLGFPYSWVAGYFAGTMNFLPFTQHVPVGIAVVHFTLWLLITALVAFPLHRLAKRRKGS